MDSNCFQCSPSSSRRVCKYDVFLSFRGDDTRNNFTDHLYNHLLRKGIFSFKDDKRLEKGQPISPQLLQAIRDSRVSIVVFSKDYAASTWCLEEMAAIVDCHQELEQVVFPVFYGVDPSHVRQQNGVYEDAFVLHTEKFKEDPSTVDRWKRAMTGLANSAGWDVRDKPESIEIGRIVQQVIKALNHKFSNVDDLVGIQSRVEKLEKVLKLSSEDDEFRVLGIWGMAGIGKKTHATVLYDRISYQFDACCFIENVSKIYKDGGVLAIQKQILRQTLDEKNLDTYSPSEVSGIIANRLHNIKVLIALENVDKLEQLQELAINPKLLAAGSRIIITTMDEHILEVYGADEVHEVPLLNNDDARELLCRKAFKTDYPSNNCQLMIPEVLKYVQGLPLAIRVLGSFLYRRDATQWRDALDRLGNNPPNEIMDVLQISFHGLQSEEQQIFLHITCFFKGERVEYVKRILEVCELHPHIGIPRIAEKSLITIRNQEIHVHDLLQEFGMNFVRQKFPGQPRLWSRLWLYQDFHDALMTDEEPNNVEAIVLEQKEDVSKYNQLRAAGLSKMRGLRLLILYQNLTGTLKFLPNSLRYIFWRGYPFSSLLLSYEPYNSLMELNMPDSSIQHLWKGPKRFPRLQRMDLSNSKHLLETPNFEWSPNIVRLDFTGCTNLQHVHQSIGLLEQLAFLSFQNCSNLVSLDLGTHCKLFSMRVLHLSGCTKLKNTPDFSGLLNLEYLDLEQCSSLSTVHDSIGALELLKFLSLRGCTLCLIPPQIQNLRSLVTLDLRGCVKLDKISSMDSDHFESLIILDLGFCDLRDLPSTFGELMCLERLNLEGNNFVSMPSAINLLYSLAYLNLSHCKMLEHYPRAPLENASSVGKYFKLVSGSRNHGSGFYAFNCPNIKNFGYPIEELLQPTEFSWLERLVRQPSHFRGGFGIVVSGTEIPKWFKHEFEPGSAIRIVHSDVNDNWIGFAFCVAFDISYGSPNSGSSDNSSSSQQTHPLYLSFEGEHVEECFHMPLRLELDQIQGSKQEHLWLIYISRRHCHFVKTGAHITFKAHSGLNIRKWGLRTVFNSTDFHSTDLPSADFHSSDYPFIQEILRRKRLKRYNEWNDGANQVNCLPFVVCACESYNSSAGPKIQLPYNWLVSEEEENEKMIAEQKENSFSNVGLEIGQPRLASFNLQHYH